VYIRGYTVVVVVVVIVESREISITPNYFVIEQFDIVDGGGGGGVGVSGVCE